MTTIQQLREANRQKTNIIELLETDVAWQMFLRRAFECKAVFAIYTEGPISDQLVGKLEKLNVLLKDEG